jgi:hypothetical protein
VDLVLTDTLSGLKPDFNRPLKIAPPIDPVPMIAMRLMFTCSV